MKRWTMFNYPYPRASLFSRWAGLAKGFNFSAFLDGTQKTLGVINQAIPVVYQVKPIINNAKTMFRIANSMKSSNDNNNSTTNTNTNISNNNFSNNNTTSTNKPIFYI